MKLLFSTASLPHYGIVRAFQFAKQAGYSGMELVISKNFDTQNADYIKSVADETKMPVIALRLGLETTIKNIELAINLARKINIETLIFTPPLFLDFKAKQWIRFELQKYKQKEQYKIVFENTGDINLLGLLPSRSYNNFQELAELGNFSLDTSNVFAKKASLLKLWNALKDKIDYVTLSNYRRNQDHILPMDGMLPLESLLDRMARHKYDKNICIKVHPKVLHEGDDQKVIHHLKETSEFVYKFFDYAGFEKKENAS
jgi:sugar phosphate isomerase/epimerase